MDVREYLKDWIEVSVKGGFTTEKELLADIGERVADEVEEGAKSMTTELRAYARERFAKQRLEEKKWKKRTVNDAIDAAFDALAEAGIVAMQNAGYTMSEGWEDCNAEASELREIGEPPLGATFYHGQDLERGVKDAGLMLAFGAYEKNKKKHEAASLAVARQVVETLERFGVKTRWDGNVDKRIEIRPFAWQKRQFTKAPK